MADTARAQKIADRIKTLTAENLDVDRQGPRPRVRHHHRRPRHRRPPARLALLHRVRGCRPSARQTARLLELNKGKLRSFVGKQLGIRLTPSLEFIADAIPETAAHLEDLLQARPRSATRQVAARRGRRRPRRRRRPLQEGPRATTRTTTRATRSRRATRPRVPTPRSRVSSPAEPTPDGILVVDKPQGWTSHDVVARARRLCATRKVGHAGTLDPMATGVLVLGVGRATRLLTFLVGCDKDYTATIRLGQATLTDDAEGEVTSASGRCTASTERTPWSRRRRPHRRHRAGAERGERDQGQGGARLPPRACR